MSECVCVCVYHTHCSVCVYTCTTHTLYHTHTSGPQELLVYLCVRVPVVNLCLLCVPVTPYKNIYSVNFEDFFF